MQSRYFLTLLVIMAFSTGMNEHGGVFDGADPFLTAGKALQNPAIAQSIYRDNSEDTKGGGGSKDKDAKKGSGKGAKSSGKASGSVVRNVQDRPPVRDRERVQDRVPVKRP